MGVGYSASFGYGFQVNPDELEELAVKTGYLPYGYETQDEAIEENNSIIDDDWEFMEWFAKQNELMFGVAGNSYSGDYSYLIGNVASAYDFGFHKTKFDVPDKEKIDRIAAIYDKTADWHVGIHIY